MRLVALYLLAAADSATLKADCFAAIGEALEANSQMQMAVAMLEQCGATINVLDDCATEHAALQDAHAAYSMKVAAVRSCALRTTEAASRPRP